MGSESHKIQVLEVAGFLKEDAWIPAIGELVNKIFLWLDHEFLRKMMETPYGSVSLSYDDEYPEMKEVYEANELSKDLCIEIELLPQRLYHKELPLGLRICDLSYRNGNKGFHEFPPF